MHMSMCFGHTICVSYEYQYVYNIWVGPIDLRFSCSKRIQFGQEPILYRTIFGYGSHLDVVIIIIKSNFSTFTPASYVCLPSTML